MSFLRKPPRVMLQETVLVFYVMCFSTLVVADKQLDHNLNLGNLPRIGTYHDVNTPQMSVVSRHIELSVAADSFTLDHNSDVNAPQLLAGLEGEADERPVVRADHTTRGRARLLVT